MKAPSFIASAVSTAGPGEELAIRFVNTAAWRLRSDVEERLPSPEALLNWFRSNGLLSNTKLKELRLHWNRDVDLGRSAYGSAIALRETIYNLFNARIRGTAPDGADLNTLNGFLFRDEPGTGIAWHGGGYGWQVSSVSQTSLLIPIAFSAAELLTGMRADRVRQCQDDRGCGWLFVDESRARNRRWCSMGDCGNRAKAHRHYVKVRRQHTKRAAGRLG